MGKIRGRFGVEEERQAVAITGEELCTLLAERMGKIAIACAHAYAKGAKIMALTMFEVLGEYVETEEDSGVPFLPKISSKAAVTGLKMAFQAEGVDFDDFMAYRKRVGDKETRLLEK